MISANGLNEIGSTSLRRAVVTLPQKRRSKIAHEASVAEAASHRHSRMKRSGQMSFHWRTERHAEKMNTIRISPEILMAA
jgi:hypothetical protein